MTSWLEAYKKMKEQQAKEESLSPLPNEADYAEKAMQQGNGQQAAQKAEDNKKAQEATWAELNKRGAVIEDKQTEEKRKTDPTYEHPAYVREQRRQAENAANREQTWAEMDKRGAATNPEAVKDDTQSAVVDKATAAGSTPKSEKQTEAVITNETLDTETKLKRMKSLITDYWNAAPELKKTHQQWYDSMMASNDLVTVARGFNALAKQMAGNSNYRRRMVDDWDSWYQKAQDYSGVYGYDEVDFKISKRDYLKAKEGDSEARKEIAQAAEAGDKKAQAMLPQLNLSDAEMETYGLDDDDKAYFSSLDNDDDRSEYIQSLKSNYEREQLWNDRTRALEQALPGAKFMGNHINFNTYEYTQNGKKMIAIYDPAQRKWVSWSPEDRESKADEYRSAESAARKARAPFGDYTWEPTTGSYRSKARAAVRRKQESRRKKEDKD